MKERKNGGNDKKQMKKTKEEVKNLGLWKCLQI